MAYYLVTGCEANGRGFDCTVLAYDEADARFAAKCVCSRGRKGVRILTAERY